LARKLDMQNLSPHLRPSVAWFAPLLLLALLAGGCATSGHLTAKRPFDFHTDTFAFANGLKWDYQADAKGRWTHHRQKPAPDYTLHCFVLARSARQFFQNARFNPSLPRTNQNTYAAEIRQVTAIDPSHPLPEDRRIVIPGYANLRQFSAAQEPLLKAQCGGAWQSYLQRGNWRMVFPLTRRHQEKLAAQLIEDVTNHCPPVVHLLRFPQLTLNHAVLVIAATQAEQEILFSIYDPNQPDAPETLRFDRASRTFTLPANRYWPGGRVDVYGIYRDLWH